MAQRHQKTRTIFFRPGFLVRHNSDQNTTDPYLLAY
nr:MAG TPA: hypothetical protein [Caudoviricetes sp.]